MPVTPSIKMLAAVAAFAPLLGCGSPEANSLGWMSPEVKAAWDSGYKGAGATIIVVDNHNGSPLTGRMLGPTQQLSHGGWTAAQAGAVAPQANVKKVDYIAASNSGYALDAGLNVVNNSFAYLVLPSQGYSSLPNLEQTTVLNAFNGTAVVVKAAGNDSQVMTSTLPSGYKDGFATSLVGAQANIFVGALAKNGTTAAPASSATYSNTPGSNATVQNNFVVVGVESDKMGLAGTSFAAPIVSGYAAILGSKFKTATPTQITNQILGTARTDTIQSYSASKHGRGEASLSRALAPSALQ